MLKQITNFVKLFLLTHAVFKNAAYKLHFLFVIRART